MKRPWPGTIQVTLSTLDAQIVSPHKNCVHVTGERHPKLYLYRPLTMVNPSLRLLVTRGKQNQVRDFLRVRHQRYVTRIQFDGRRVHALGQESLELRIDRAIFGRHLIPGRFHSPRRNSARALEAGVLVIYRIGGYSKL